MGILMCIQGYALAFGYYPNGSALTAYTARALVVWVLLTAIVATTIALAWSTTTRALPVLLLTCSRAEVIVISGLATLRASPIHVTVVIWA
jgi:hypothetical protein